MSDTTATEFFERLKREEDEARSMLEAARQGDSPIVGQAAAERLHTAAARHEAVKQMWRMLEAAPDLASLLDKARAEEREAITALVKRWHLDASADCGLRDMPGGAPPLGVFKAIDELVERIRARGAR